MEECESVSWRWSEKARHKPRFVSYCVPLPLAHQHPEIPTVTLSVTGPDWSLHLEIPAVTPLSERSPEDLRGHARMRSVSGSRDIPQPLLFDPHSATPAKPNVHSSVALFRRSDGLSISLGLPTIPLALRIRPGNRKLRGQAEGMA